MPYYSRGDDDVDDFDEYDPTPYGGGYDITLTYGRPIPPSDETCYPITSSTSDEFDYDRPQYTSYAEPSAYNEEALNTEYSSYDRPKPRPAPAFNPGAEPGGQYGGRPEPAYGLDSDVNRPDYGGSAYGSGYGRKNEYDQPSSDYGSGYGRKPEYEAPPSEYGSGYGRKPEYEAPSSEYGAGYGRKPEYEAPTSEYGSAYVRRTEHETGESEYGSGYGRKPSSGEEEGGGYGYGGRTERPAYEDEPPRRPSYGRPTYESQEGGEHGYGRSEEEYRGPSYERRDDDDKPRKYGYSEEGYGRKKYGDDSGDDDDGERKHHRHKHHHHKSYDDE
ncbi:uncharacterized protein At5g39570-like isoform X2 [Neltuma alba]|uniref:uncharacterized protein At5g39570-like isoform X2 n=1 Tax=Neltuma alba TaxID=207710 RepID=UPI0010A51882|nr:uncharacterized protein At5g39570-like isoform X2 [Prosopis alba]